MMNCTSIAVALSYIFFVHLKCYEIIYKGPDSSLAAIEFAPLKSPLNVKPGAFVELKTCHSLVLLVVTQATEITYHFMYLFASLLTQLSHVLLQLIHE